MEPQRSLSPADHCLAAQELIPGCPPHHVRAVKFQERFPLRTLGADFIYINKNQKKWGWGCAIARSRV